VPTLDDVRIAVLGLGYVGFPLAVEFGKQFDTVGFDLNAKRIDELSRQHDRTREVSADEMASAVRLKLSCSRIDIADRDVFIVAVPTPIDEAKRPDLGPLTAACRTVAEVLRTGGIVIFESTVYPGVTEEVCAPLIAEISGLKFNRDFTCGYSPERANPGDKEHRLTTIVKVTAGSTPETAEFVDKLYGAIVTAGTHRAPSIKIAEAAKVIENTQRDLNIALVNELAIIFNRLGIDTGDVLSAAGTKWNFLPFKPGLVGGHCIGVDPYYLTHKAQEVGYHPEVILAGRRINDSMGRYVADQIIRLLVKHGINPIGARLLMLGFAFKENCPDLRNTRVIDVVHELTNYRARVDIYDPLVDADEVAHEYGVDLLNETPTGGYDCVILAVGHKLFCDWGTGGMRNLLRDGGVVYDVKGVLPRESVDERL